MKLGLSDRTRAERDAYVEGLLKEQFGRAGPADAITPEHQILLALAPLASAGVFSGMGEDQVRDAVEAAVHKLRLPAGREGALNTASLKRGPEKPRFGEPCNGCGYCCTAQPCAIAQDHLGAGYIGPCPALLFDEEQAVFRCGMVVSPTRFMNMPEDPFLDLVFGGIFAQQLAVGRGCDSEDFAPLDTTEADHG